MIQPGEKEVSCYFCGANVNGPGMALGGCGQPLECTMCTQKRWNAENKAREEAAQVTR